MARGSRVIVQDASLATFDACVEEYVKPLVEFVKETCVCKFISTALVKGTCDSCKTLKSLGFDDDDPPTVDNPRKLTQQEIDALIKENKELLNKLAGDNDE